MHKNGNLIIYEYNNLYLLEYFCTHNFILFYLYSWTESYRWQWPEFISEMNRIFHMLNNNLLLWHNSIYFSISSQLQNLLSFANDSIVSVFLTFLQSQTTWIYNIINNMTNHGYLKYFTHDRKYNITHLCAKHIH